MFLPTIVKSLGYVSSTAQLMTVPIYGTAAVLSVVVAYLSDKAGKRSPFIICLMFVILAGYTMLVGPQLALKKVASQPVLTAT